jgi:hypothetical protein
MKIFLGLASMAWAACNESSLHLATDRYVSSQSTGSLLWLGDMLNNRKTYFENGKTVAVTSNQTAFSIPLRVDHRQSIFDLVQCASFTSLVDSDPATPRIIGAQLWLSDDKVTKIDRIITTPGD